MRTHIKSRSAINRIFGFKNKAALICIFIFLAPFSFAQEISRNAQSLIDSFFNLRMNLSVYEESDTESIIAEIERFGESNADKIGMLSEQEKIILENFSVMEKYNYLYKLPGQAKIQHEILGSQLEKIEAFLKQNSSSQLSAYFYCTQADVTSCYMGYSIGDVLKYGASVKVLYEKALGLSPEFSYALTNIGQWYYFSPKIAGGSKKKTLSCFEKARENAATEAQKYFADIFLSQILFENGESEKCRALLDEALSFCPESTYVKKIIAINQSGLSLYEYNRKKSPLDEKNAASTEFPGQS
ncbi:tetratricopeptide repeat protein [Treponema sp.]|uniref:tetratricopeptide repeat protein n=1 Tax=Treponema sp. TaxID=166 RepID=UPI003F0E825F